MCAELDHLVYLPRGDAALTRRSKKYSSLYAVVLEWSRARKRYERQGLLVEEDALERAEKECLADSEVRARRRRREAEKRMYIDQEYVENFARRIRELYPGCPEGVDQKIAEHACLINSGRVGRTASAKNLDVEAVKLAVIAYIRHNKTEYDRLINTWLSRQHARAEVEDKVHEVLSEWISPSKD